MTKKAVKKAVAKKKAPAAKKVAKTKAKQVTRRRAETETAPEQLELLEQQATREPSSMDTSTLRPGFLISLKTSVRGNVVYRKETLEEEHRLRSGAARAAWKTERTVSDPDEDTKAKQVRMKARMLVVNECAISAFGLLCPENNLQRLELAIKEARKLINAFNRTATLSRVAIYVISGRVARDDVEAARAIKGEIREILAAMAEGVKISNAETIRAATSKARNIESMLAPDAAAALKGVVTVVRATARKITKAGEGAANEVDRAAIRAINEARTAFIDLDDDDTELAPAEETGRAVEMDDAPVGRYRREATAEA